MSLSMLTPEEIEELRISGEWDEGDDEDLALERLRLAGAQGPAEPGHYSAVTDDTGVSNADMNALWAQLHPVADNSLPSEPLPDDTMAQKSAVRLAALSEPYGPPLPPSRGYDFEVENLPGGKRRAKIIK